jgi:LPS O-antigen subunit length determinant protein (WzzB/FepE family)
MKKNINYIENDLIDIFKLIKELYKNKILILSISILCIFLALQYASIIPKKYKTEIVTKYPPIHLFNAYNRIDSSQGRDYAHNLREEFFFNFDKNLTSIDKLEISIKQRQKINDIKEFLSTNKIPISSYFQLTKFIPVQNFNNKNSGHKYYLFFSLELKEANFFFDEYVKFIQKKTILNLKNDLQIIILDNIKELENAYAIANEIPLSNPVFINETNINYSDIYQGTKILSQKILQQKLLYSQLTTDEFDFDIILDKASIPERINHTANYLYSLAGLLFGFFLSLIIIFFKKTLEENK